MSIKTRITTAVAEEGRKGEVRDTGAISNDLHAVEKYIARLRKRTGRRWSSEPATKRARAVLGSRAGFASSASIVRWWRRR